MALKVAGSIIISSNSITTQDTEAQAQQLFTELLEPITNRLPPGGNEATPGTTATGAYICQSLVD